MKKYVVVLAPIEEAEEVEFTAKNMKEARRKARRIADEEGMYLESVEEVKDGV